MANLVSPSELSKLEAQCKYLDSKWDMLEEIWTIFLERQRHYYYANEELLVDQVLLVLDEVEKELNISGFAQKLESTVIKAKRLLAKFLVFLDSADNPAGTDSRKSKNTTWSCKI